MPQYLTTSDRNFLLSRAISSIKQLEQNSRLSVEKPACSPLSYVEPPPICTCRARPYISSNETDGLSKWRWICRTSFNQNQNESRSRPQNSVDLSLGISQMKYNIDRAFITLFSIRSFVGTPLYCIASERRAPRSEMSIQKVHISEVILQSQQQIHPASQYNWHSYLYVKGGLVFWAILRLRYGVADQGSIPHSWQLPDRLWGPCSAQRRPFPRDKSGRDVELTSHAHLLSRLRLTQL